MIFLNQAEYFRNTNAFKMLLYSVPIFKGHQTLAVPSSLTLQSYFFLNHLHLIFCFFFTTIKIKVTIIFPTFFLIELFEFLNGFAKVHRRAASQKQQNDVFLLDRCAIFSQGKNYCDILLYTPSEVCDVADVLKLINVSRFFVFQCQNGTWNCVFSERTKNARLFLVIKVFVWK